MATGEMFATIKEGMAVHDSKGDHIGVVKEIYFGTSSDEAEAYTSTATIGPNDGGVAPDIAETFGAGRELPDAIRKRLLTHGYVRIDRGFGDTRFVLADQVADVGSDGVHLSVLLDELIH
jgi:hypothetical protein